MSIYRLHRLWIQPKTQYKFGLIKDDTVENGLFSQLSSFFFSNERSHEKEYRPRKNEDVILIIQTSSVGTNASRRYNYTQLNYSEHSEWNNATCDFFQEACSEEIQIREESLSQNGTYVPLSTSDSSTPEKPCEDAEMEALKSYISPLQAKGIPTVQERLEMARDIRQKALDHLLRILFGDDGKYVKDVNQIDRISTPGEKSANNPVTVQANNMGQLLGTGWSHYS